MNKSYNIELEKYLSQLKSHLRQKIKGKDKGKRDANTKTTQRCVIEEETEVLDVKPFRHPPSGQ